MATVTKPMALDESIHTTDGNDTNIADLMQSGLAAIASAVGAIPTPTASNVSWSGTINGTAVTNVSGALTALNTGLATNTDLLGTTDISGIGDGTVTGAIDEVVAKVDRGSVSVTADGAKTLGTLLNELCDLVDHSKLTKDTKLVVDFAASTDIYWIYSWASNYIWFAAVYFEYTGVSGYYINLQNNASSRKQGSATSWTDASSSIWASGTKITVYY